MRRETSKLKPGTPWHLTRKFYKHIFPNFTVENVENPPCFFRKFAPDGRHFLAFSADQTSVEIFEFKGTLIILNFRDNSPCKHFIISYIGCDAGENLLSTVSGDVMHDRSTRFLRPESRAFHENVKEKLFSTFFKHKHLVPVAPTGQHLNRYGLS